ncbi:DUF3761 domain-containing protein [Streptomyces avermitilis]|uniref:DUF3761 domain-containing protein n=1 Tax=Streptomyces avermitilis TaxID=33903 RepID=UPI0020D059BD|nr:DUF3761 domain-containing protein [Streptomyces avermitilis]
MLSAGSWGTTMAKVFADAGSDVTVHARRPEVVAAINVRHQNARYLPDVVIARPAPRDSRPGRGTRRCPACRAVDPGAGAAGEPRAAWAPHIEPDAVVVSSMKGVETYSGLRMSEVIHQVTGIPLEQVAVLSGPDLAREILAAALVAPVAVATGAAAATCARHTTGVYKANSPHPRGATARCKDGTWSYSAHSRGTCSHHRGVKYWYR